VSVAKHATAVDYIAAPGLPLRAIAIAACQATGAALPEAQAATRRAPRLDYRHGADLLP
jgi:hypothetical protein